MTQRQPDSGYSATRADSASTVRSPVAWVPYCFADSETAIEGQYAWDEIAETPFEVWDKEHWMCAPLYAPSLRSAAGDLGSDKHDSSGAAAHTALLAVVQQMADALEYHRDQTRPIARTDAALAAGRELLKQPKQPDADLTACADEAPTVSDALDIALDALDEIALAGMSGTGMESEEGMRDWHARQAWKFIGIAARAKEAARAASKDAAGAQEQDRPVCESASGAPREQPTDTGERLTQAALATIDAFEAHAASTGSRGYQIYGSTLLTVGAALAASPQEPSPADPDWVCEEHPAQQMGHDGCKGAGMPSDRYAKELAASPQEPSPAPSADPLTQAAWELVNSVGENLDTKPWPQKYSVPYGAVNKLRAALVAAAHPVPVVQPLTDERQALLNQVLDALRMGRVACEWAGKQAEADAIRAATEAARAALSASPAAVNADAALNKEQQP